jgi:hypothetical protein
MISTWVITSGTLVARGTDQILDTVLPEELLDGAPPGFTPTGHAGVCCTLLWSGESLKNLL